MTRYVASLLLLLTAAVALAQEKPPDPDYSKDELRKVLHVQISELAPKPPPNRHFHFGYVEFRALGMNWRLVYLPIAAPLPGSGPLGARTMPTAFTLLSSRLSPGGPPMLEDEPSAATKRELRRIRKTTARTKLEK